MRETGGKRRAVVKRVFGPVLRLSQTGVEGVESLPQLYDLLLLRREVHVVGYGRYHGWLSSLAIVQVRSYAYTCWGCPYTVPKGTRFAAYTELAYCALFGIILNIELLYFVRPQSMNNFQSVFSQRQDKEVSRRT